MATPTTNTVSYSNVATAAMPELIVGQKWGGALGTGVTLEFSFLNADSEFRAGYPNGWQSSHFELTTGEKDAIRGILASVSDFIDVSFNEVTETSVFNGDIRFGGSSTSPNYAYAYYPWSTAEAGDVWFGNDWNNDFGQNHDAVEPGSHEYVTVIHELGHALGLKHSFEGGPALPASEDNYFYTVMSYTASPWSPSGNNYASFKPTTFMYYDLVALQALYGRESSHNSGNTTHTFQDGQTYFQTIDDAGGRDTIRFVGAQGCDISLLQGAFSAVSEAIEFKDGPVSGAYTTSRFTVCIGPNTVIENATGGGGADVLGGNSVANVLTGNGGNDKLSGLGGADTLIGGAGRDRMIGGAADDKFVLNVAATGSNYDTITDFKHAGDTIQLENSVFAALGAVAANLASTKFFVGANAHDATDRIIYNRATGDLYYDADGNRAGAKVLIAHLDSGLALTASDFQVI